MQRSIFQKRSRKFTFSPVMKPNVFITGECFTRRPEYFSITFFYIGFVTQVFRGFERRLQCSMFQCINANKTGYKGIRV